MLSVTADGKSHKVVIVGAGASGISAAAKLLENGYDNIVVLEAENRVGGRVYSIPFGEGFVDLGAQWCEGDEGNIVYDMVKNDFELVQNDISLSNSHAYTSDGKLVDRKKFEKLLNFSMSIGDDYENQAKFNKSLGEFYEIHYWNGLNSSEFDDIDMELADQVMDLSERAMNSAYSSESWYDVSTKLMLNNGAGDVFPFHKQNAFD